MTSLNGDNWKMATGSVELKRRIMKELHDMTDEDRLQVLRAIVKAAADDDMLDRIAIILSDEMIRRDDEQARRKYVRLR